MLDWFQTCGQTHKYCAQIANTTFRPSRLIDLGLDFDFRRAHLVERADEEFYVDYLALSYVWGNVMPEPAKTNWKTLEEHKSRIRTSKLPRTFRHFFEIAKVLNVRYVWIDSLCIIQDSEEDFLRETAAMGFVPPISYCL